MFDSPSTKPGLQANPVIKTVVNADGEEVEVIDFVEVGPISQIDDGLGATEAIESTAPLGASAAYDDRKRGIFGTGLFNLQWDKWDQILLRNSTSTLKKLFKNHYYSRDFDEDPQDQNDEGTLAIMRLREALKPAPGRQLVPWWMKRLLRTNPFNSEGELCKRSDE